MVAFVIVKCTVYILKLVFSWSDPPRLHTRGLACAYHHDYVMRRHLAKLPRSNTRATPINSEASPINTTQITRGQRRQCKATRQWCCHPVHQRRQRRVCLVNCNVLPDNNFAVFLLKVNTTRTRESSCIPTYCYSPESSRHISFYSMTDGQRVVWSLPLHLQRQVKHCEATCHRQMSLPAAS